MDGHKYPWPGVPVLEPAPLRRERHAMLDKAKNGFSAAPLPERTAGRVARNRMRIAWMYYVEGLTQNEIADRLGIGRVTVVRNINEALKQHFRPEFLNRIDETIVFSELSKPEVIQIVDHMIGRVGVQLAGQGMGLEITEAAKLLLADRGYDPTMGARPLRRAIQRLVEDPLSEKLLWKEFRAGQIIRVDVAPDPENPAQQVFTFEGVEGFIPPTVGDVIEAELAATGGDVAGDAPIVP